VLEAIRKRPGGIAIGAGLRIGENTTYYVITAFSITYITEVVHLSRSIALNALLAGAAVEVMLIPVFAWLSDKIGRRPILFLGSAGMALFGFAFFRMLETGATPMVLAAVTIGLVLHGAMYAPQAAFIAELFPTRFRYSGASLAYQATSIFAGSVAPIIALALFKATKSATPIAIYMLIAGSIGAFSAFRARETKGMSFAQIDAETE
jgi:MFS family permease